MNGKLKHPTDDRKCGNCKRNIINTIFGVYFDDEKRCTGTCAIAPVSGIYYNQIELVCDYWEDRQNAIENETLKK